MNAVLQVPGINASWQPDFIRQYNNVDISVAVQTPIGLLTPIVKDADLKGLSAISTNVKDLATKVGWEHMVSHRYANFYGQHPRHSRKCCVLYMVLMWGDAVQAAVCYSDGGLQQQTRSSYPYASQATVRSFGQIVWSSMMPKLKSDY